MARSAKIRSLIDEYVVWWIEDVLDMDALYELATHYLTEELMKLHVDEVLATVIDNGFDQDRIKEILD